MSRTCPGATAESVAKSVQIDVPPAGEIQKAHFDFWIPKGSIAGVLMLADGENEAATRYIEDAQWRAFAQKHHLAICGVWLVSEERLLRNNLGYYNAARGAGDMLLQAIAQAGFAGKPLWMVGFSGGALFANSFVVWKPGAVKGWVASSGAGWIRPPANEKLPPGVITCGDYDGVRYGDCLAYVQQLRGNRNPIVWISVRELSHHRNIPIEDFGRQFFEALMAPDAADPVCVDNIKKSEAHPKAEWEWGLTSELPSASLLPSWRALHHP